MLRIWFGYTGAVDGTPAFGIPLGPGLEKRTETNHSTHMVNGWLFCSGRRYMLWRCFVYDLCDITFPFRTGWFRLFSCMIVAQANMDVQYTGSINLPPPPPQGVTGDGPLSRSGPLKMWHRPVPCHTQGNQKGPESGKEKCVGVRQKYSHWKANRKRSVPHGPRVVSLLFIFCFHPAFARKVNGYHRSVVFDISGLLKYATICAICCGNGSIGRRIFSWRRIIKTARKTLADKVALWM